MSTTATVVVNETDVTHLAVEGSVTKRLNNVGQASARFQMKDLAATLGEPVRAGMLMKVYFENPILGTTPVLWHHGRVMISEVVADEDNGYIVVNSADPLELWKYRLVRDPGGEAHFVSSCGTFSLTNDPGDFSKPSIIQDFVTGPEIVEAMMFATQNIALGADDADGPLFLKNGTFACGGTNLTGVPKDWPMTMMELASLLTSTGELDIICQPIELDIDGNYGELSAYNGNFGLDLTSSVAFQYGMGAFNVRALRWNEDMTDLSNKLEYLLGPKCDDQHWQANITGTAGQQFPITAVNQGTQTFTVTGDASGIDGLPAGEMLVVTGSTGNDGEYTVVSSVFSVTTTDIIVVEAIPDATADGFAQTNFWSTCGLDAPSKAQWIAWHAAVVACTGTEAGIPTVGTFPGDSRGDYGVRMDIKIFDAAGDNPICLSGGQPEGFCFSKRNWLQEAFLRCRPRTIIHVTPTRDTAIGEFDIGDLVLVEAHPDVNGGFSGGQRVYSYTVSWDAEDSVPAIGELQVSSDQENFA